MSRSVRQSIPPRTASEKGMAGASCTITYFSDDSMSSLALLRRNVACRSRVIAYEKPMPTSALLSNPHNECTRSLKLP